MLVPIRGCQVREITTRREAAKDFHHKLLVYALYYSTLLPAAFAHLSKTLRDRTKSARKHGSLSPFCLLQSSQILKWHQSPSPISDLTIQWKHKKPQPCPSESAGNIFPPCETKFSPTRRRSSTSLATATQNLMSLSNKIQRSKQRKESEHASSNGNSQTPLEL